MKHEFLNGDATKEIIVDNSVDLFVMWPPYLGVDLERYGNKDQLNNVNDVVIFSKKLAKIAKNCEKALKDNGNLIYIIPHNDPSLSHYMLKYISKKTKLVYNGTLVWDYYDAEYIDKNRINGNYALILWFSKGSPKVNNEVVGQYHSSVMRYPLMPRYLVDKYGSMGHVEDALPETVAKHLIELFTVPGDTVANVLGGTGTITAVAEMTERDSVYNDISYVQLTIAKKRLEDIIAEKKKKRLS